MNFTDNILTIKDLSVIYNNGVKALDLVNLEIPKGKRVAILGPNGAGKSTLVKSILQLEKYQTGTITLLNETKNIQSLIKTKVAYIPQKNTINTQFPTTVLDVVTMGRYAYISNWLKKPSKYDKHLALNALEKMELSHLKNRHITELSGGQQQRVFIARALVQEAELFIMDEPLAGVDIKTEEIIMQTLKEFQQDNKTSIVIHHDLHTVKNYFDYVVWLNKTILNYGEVEQSFTDEWYQKTYHQSVSLSPFAKKI